MATLSWTANAERFANDGISEDEAQDMLRRDAGIAERAVLRLITVPLTDGQFDALSSFAFNLGGGALQRSTLRRKVNREEHALVPAEFEVGVGRWAEAKGLVRRWEADAVRRSPAAIGGLQPRPAPTRHTLWSELISGSLASWDRCALSASTTPVPGRQI